jgi:hypothetical protein
MPVLILRGKQHRLRLLDPVVNTRRLIGLGRRWPLPLVLFLSLASFHSPLIKPSQLN